MVIEIEVDATFGDGFYYHCFFYSQKELGFTESYLQLLFEKSYKWMWDLKTFAQIQGSETSTGLFQDFTNSVQL